MLFPVRGFGMQSPINLARWLQKTRNMRFKEDLRTGTESARRSRRHGRLLGGERAHLSAMKAGFYAFNHRTSFSRDPIWVDERTGKEGYFPFSMFKTVKKKLTP